MKMVDEPSEAERTATANRTVIVVVAIVAAAAIAISAIIVVGGKSQDTASHSGSTSRTTSVGTSSKCETLALFDLVQQNGKSLDPTAVASSSGSVNAYCSGGWAVLQNFTVQAGSGYGLAVFKQGSTGWRFVMFGDTSGGAGYISCSQYPAQALLALGAHLCAVPTATTSTTTAPTTTAPPPLPVVQTCGPGSAQGIRPTTIFIGCATGDVSLTNITWTSWSASSAVGSATYNVNQCDPSCAAGNTTAVPASIMLTGPTTLGGVLVFQNLAVAPTTGAPVAVSLADGSGTWGSA